MSFTAIVPVRAGSKGLPGKNLRPLAGVPLWQRAVDQAVEAGAARVILSTDIPELLSMEHTAPVTLHPRPEALARDDTPMAPVIADAVEGQGITGPVVLLQVTSPLRTVDDIRNAVALYGKGDSDLVMSVTEADRGVLKYGLLSDGRFHALSDPSHPFTNRQALPPVYRPNGAVYVFDAEWFLRNGGFATERTAAHVMPPERSHDIDTMEDLERIETLLRP
ncbi:acylneuraminate cytidylyltransferase family protein [Alphaproteobacteria bacterium GH1-50]|uniref:Acylneuraminate cytidylyltransferase family protein n=1 Tax=Kangsaoukella pontilimi TaxID=2691042 RepID=A0A7C9MHV2_9RHOB|nr:acylneuraminate cytidylyltransferase family protein [Kangsaoukella pontilimi]MXQ06415.1 acylneuraminate cytidylyltransferase family protein [Kangsaoukella pontilimi]